MRSRSFWVGVVVMGLMLFHMDYCHRYGKATLEKWIQKDIERGISKDAASEAWMKKYQHSPEQFQPGGLYASR